MLFHQALHVICYSKVFLTYKRYAIRRNAKYQMLEMSQCIDLPVACHPKAAEHHREHLQKSDLSVACANVRYKG